MLRDSDSGKMGRVTQAFLRMKRFDVEALECALAGR
jgi:hypothetical protein